MAKAEGRACSCMITRIQPYQAGCKDTTKNYKTIKELKVLLFVNLKFKQTKHV